MNLQEQISDLLSERYIVKHKLGQGGSGITYSAEDRDNNRQVAIKVLTLSGLDNWKKVELFEREAKVLQKLNHFAIPQYLDYFKQETDSDIFFCLVQQLAPGKSLARLIADDWYTTKTEVQHIAEQILNVLVYLQQLNPPVIHRDLKPENIIYQPDTGKVFLVDFGAVQDVYHHTVLKSTLVGTYGYMAPEQYRGRAFLGTDLYSLGCTLLFLLTRESPGELPLKRLKIDFRKVIKIESDFANWLDKLIEPNIKKRFAKAEDALLVLQEKASLDTYKSNIIDLPKYSSLKLSKGDNKLAITIPQVFNRKYKNSTFYLITLWLIIAFLNRLAIFASTNLFGKAYLTLATIKIFCYGDDLEVPIQIIQGILFFIWLLIFLFGQNLAIPFFSGLIFAIDFLLPIVTRQNIAVRFLYPSRIRRNNNDNTLPQNSQIESTSKNQIILEKKIIGRWQKEKKLKDLLKDDLMFYFLTAAEIKWMLQEVRSFKVTSNE